MIAYEDFQDSFLKAIIESWIEIELTKFTNIYPANSDSSYPSL